MNFLDPKYAQGLEQRIVERATNEWPGVHTTPTQIITVGPVRPGGATETLIRFTAHIAVEEMAV